jgi:antitoxin YefM
MAIEITGTKLRKELTKTLDRVIDDCEVVIVRRRGARDVAILPASELTSLMETAYLLRSPRNAGRLLKAAKRTNRRAAPWMRYAGMIESGDRNSGASIDEVAYCRREP